MAAASYPLNDSEEQPTTTETDRSPESILEEYQDRSEQVARLEAAIADPETDDDMRDYYQDLLDVENNILNDLTTEALAAGIPQSELDQTTTDATTDATTTATNNPIELQEGDEAGLLDDTWTITYINSVQDATDESAWNLLDFSSGNNVGSLFVGGVTGVFLELLPMGIYRGGVRASENLEQSIENSSGTENIVLRYVGRPALWYARIRSGGAAAGIYGRVGAGVLGIVNSQLQRRSDQQNKLDDLAREWEQMTGHESSGPKSSPRVDTGNPLGQTPGKK